MKPALTKIFLTLTAAEGLFMIAWFFLLPSEASSAVLFGLSKARLALVFVTGLVFLVFATLSVFSWTSRAWQDRIHRILDHVILDRKNLVPAVMGAAAITLILAAFIILVTRLSQADYSMYYSVTESSGFEISTLLAVFTRMMPLIVWGTLITLQMGLWIGFRYHTAFRDRSVVSTSVILYTLVGIIAAVLTAVLWIILVFRVPVLVNLPGWYWVFIEKTYSARHLLLIVLLAALLGLAWWMLKRPGQVAWKLAALFVMGYAFQLGMGIMDGQGIESLRLKVFTTQHRAYASFASRSDQGVLESIRNYEDLYGQSMFPSTKPPGVMAVYIGMERLLNTIDPQVGSDARFLNITNFIAWTFPFISLLIIPLFYFFVRKAMGLNGDHPAQFLAPLLFIITPNIVLMTLFLDQAVYPALFLTGALLIVWMFRRQSIGWAFATGVFLYAAIFLSFSMLPLFCFLIVYAAIDWWLNRSERTIPRQLKLLAFCGLGVLALLGLFRFWLNYDIVTRYKTAMSVVYNFDHYLREGLQVQESVTLVGRLKQILDAAYFNNLEFAVAVGIPVFLLFLTRSVQIVKAFIQRTATRADGVQAAFLLSYLAMNALGQMRGEVSRLWMFWVPMIVIFAAVEIAPLVKRKPSLVYLLLTAQTITMFLIFQYQDLKM